MTITGKKYVDCTILGSGGGAEAEDSSYDSDYEAEDNTTTTSSVTTTATTTPLVQGKLSTATHSEVSRTSSDTLAAEFAEYVTVHGAALQSISTPPTHSPGYAARVEFALKLGYTERLVQTALQKLGPEPGQNELLAELIKLGANGAPRLADTADESEALLPAEYDEAATGPEPVALRPIVVDGSNVAMSHGNKEIFSCRGIKICVDWLRARGHREITVFVPKWRKETSRPDNPIVEQDILVELERERLLVFTPSRLVGGKRMVCYDDRYILRLAAEIDGIVVSNDNYRDLAQENPEFRKVVEERILMYSFVNDRFMPPDDPLGRSGPTLDNFLKVGSRRTEPALPCPYAKKCTYGNKCKFRHPERTHPHKSVTERLVEHAQRHLQARGPSLSFPLATAAATATTVQHPSLSKTSSWTPGDSSALKSKENLGPVDSTTPPQPAYAQPIHNAQAAQGFTSSHGWIAPRVVNPDPEPANMHRKLQRQLTLNPGCDPRINQLRVYHHHQQQQQQQQLLASQKQSQPLRSFQTITGSPHSMMQNKQLARHASNDSSYPIATSWEQQQQQQQQQRHRQFRHQHVTRIASAPDSYRAWQPRVNRNNNNNSSVSNGSSVAPAPPAMTSVQRLGASDSQLNLLRTSGNLATNTWNTAQHQDARRHLHYHLANIFPEEQVQAAMALHPRKTDPQQICAAILTMFPKL